MQMTIFDFLEEGIATPKVNVDIDLFTRELRRMVFEAITFLGYTNDFDETTEIALQNVTTSANNKYFPKGCAMTDIYLLSDKAFGKIMLANQYALKNNMEWVEYRNYDHRYFKKWHHHCTPLEKCGKNNVTTVKRYREIHFRTKVNEVWFGNTGRSEYVQRMIKDFFDWGFI